MITVGVEGPVLAGKSTLIMKLRERLSQDDVATQISPCYVDFALSTGWAIPEPITTKEATQLAALNQFFKIDQLRHASLRTAPLTILDRTPATLVAHCFGVAACGGPDVTSEAERLFLSACKSGRMPSNLIYLQTEVSTMLERLPSRDFVPDPFLRADFNRAFNEFFSKRLPDLWPTKTHFLDTRLSVDELVVESANYVLQMVQ